MINGSFNTVFQGSLASKVHLKLLSPKKFIPEVDQLSEDEPLPEGEYLMFRSKLEMPGQELNHLDVLIPVDLGNQFDPPAEVQAEENSAAGVSETASESGDAAATAGESSPSLSESSSTDAGVDSIVVLEDDDVDRQLMVEAVAFTGFQVMEGTLNADLKELFSGRNVRLVLIGSMDADDRELAVCIKINAIRQDAPPPIIMSAHRWTRTAVLKALKYGAREIIIKPCGEDELAAKVRRFCKLPPP
jgi:CheY-like chemotaxis protein